MFGLVELEFRLRWSLEFDLILIFFWGGAGFPNSFLHILFSLVNIRLHTENWLCKLPGSALKVPGGGGWLESKLSDQL